MLVITFELAVNLMANYLNIEEIKIKCKLHTVAVHV